VGSNEAKRTGFILKLGNIKAKLTGFNLKLGNIAMKRNKSYEDLTLLIPASAICTGVNIVQPTAKKINRLKEDQAFFAFAGIGTKR
jgi:hypothetical protein